MELNYKTAYAIKQMAIWIDEILLCNSLIDLYKNDRHVDIDRYIARRQKAYRKGVKNVAEFQRHYNMSNSKMKRIIFDLICSQFINNEVFNNEDFDEIQDGPFHPVFCDNWVDSLNGYQIHLMPTSSMIGMKF